MPPISPQPQHFYLGALKSALAPLLSFNFRQMYFDGVKIQSDEACVEHAKTVAEINAKYKAIEEKHPTRSNAYVRKNIKHPREKELKKANDQFQNIMREIHARNQKILGYPEMSVAETDIGAETLEAATQLIDYIRDTIQNFIIPDPKSYIAKKGMTLEAVIDDLFSPLSSLDVYMVDINFKSALNKIKSDLMYVLDAKINGLKYNSILMSGIRGKEKSRVSFLEKIIYKNEKDEPTEGYTRKTFYKNPTVQYLAVRENHNQATTTLYTEPPFVRAKGAPTPSPEENRTGKREIGDLHSDQNKQKRDLISRKIKCISTRSSRIEEFKGIISEFNFPDEKLTSIINLLDEVVKHITHIVYINPEDYKKRLDVIESKLMEALMIIDDSFHSVPDKIIGYKNNLINGIDSFKILLYFREAIMFPYIGFQTTSTDDKTIESIQIKIELIGAILQQISKTVESMMLNNETVSEINARDISASFENVEKLARSFALTHPAAHQQFLMILDELKVQVGFYIKIPVETLAASRPYRQVLGPDIMAELLPPPAFLIETLIAVNGPEEPTPYPAISPEMAVGEGSNTPIFCPRPKSYKSPGVSSKEPAAPPRPSTPLSAVTVPA